MVRVIVLDAISVKVSVITIEVSGTLPWFWIAIVYLTVSPMPRKPSPFSTTATVLVTSIAGEGVILTTVASFAVPVLGSSL